jgi:hypothetical protein
MKKVISILLIVTMSFAVFSCKKKEQEHEKNIIFLHHSTGGFLWYGKRASVFNRAIGLISKDLKRNMRSKGKIPRYFEEHNEIHGTTYRIEEQVFPKEEPYGWKNYPYDYYNIWVKHAGNEPYMEEPTLEMLSRDYQVIIFKHCFPVSRIEADQETPSVDSEHKSISNYKLQYYALRDKLHEFPETRFILFTGAVHVDANLHKEQAERTREFFDWVRQEWDQPEDNIFLWDLYSIQTEGGLYFKNEYALSEHNSHPNNYFSTYAGKLLFNRIIDVIENDGKGTHLTGQKK